MRAPAEIFMLTIPEDQKRAVKDLLKLKPAEWTNLIKAITRASPATSLKSLANKVSDDAAISQSKIYGILRVIGALSTIQAEGEYPSNEMAIELSEAAESEGMKPADGDWSAFKTRAATLIDASGPVQITVKARDLIREHQHTFCRANTRVVTDMRPVFSAGELDVPAGVAIVHTLKLAYHLNGGEDKEFFVAMDADEIHHLMDLLLRAIDKETLLSKTVQKAGMNLISDKD